MFKWQRNPNEQIMYEPFLIETMHKPGVLAKIDKIKFMFHFNGSSLRSLTLATPRGDGFTFTATKKRSAKKNATRTQTTTTKIQIITKSRTKPSPKAADTRYYIST